MSSGKPKSDAAYSLLGLVLFLVLATPIWAGKHPVPLDPNTDAATCAECHQDKAKGKVVHTAIATGCNSCHEIRVRGEITRTRLIATNPTSLCVTCHADKNPVELKAKAHAPGKACSSCHDPHTSANANVLLRPTSGGKGENLCLNCHNTGVDVPKDGSRHAALDMGCETCHQVHKTGDQAQREFKFHLTKATPALCADCHDIKSPELSKAHQNQPLEKADCMTCHDPHSSSKPKLAQKFLHQPFGDKSCDVCHSAPVDGKVVLTNTDSKALCVTCHSEQEEKINNAKVPHAGAMGECIACHDPHAGKTPGFVRPNPVAACTACHADQAEQHKKSVLHQPAFEQGCATCHEPHGGDLPKLVRAQKNDLCMECHGPDAAPGKVEGQNLVTIFNGKVRLPGDYFKKTVRLPIKFGRGHPVERHPVVNQMDPADVTKVATEINCNTCHQPHASDNRGLLLKDQASGIAFCASCHKDLGK